jgi:mono/diheme cytochrome c family protein
MSRHVIEFAALLTLGLLCVPMDAEACNRCGLFGRGCRFQATSYYYPVVQQEHPASVQNFVFNNSYPVAPLGNSVYGYSLAATAHGLDAAQVLDRSARLVEMAITSGQRALGEHNATVQGALQLGADIDRRTKNTLLAVSAIQANQDSAAAASSQSLSFKATVTNGRLAIESLDPPAGDGQRDGAAAQALGTYSLRQCAACHDGRGTNKTPTSFSLDGTMQLSREQLEACATAVIEGRMPPADRAQLDLKAKLSVAGELARLAE